MLFLPFLFIEVVFELLDGLALLIELRGDLELFTVNSIYLGPVCCVFKSSVVQLSAYALIISGVNRKYHAVVT